MTESGRVQDEKIDFRIRGAGTITHLIKTSQSIERTESLGSDTLDCSSLLLEYLLSSNKILQSLWPKVTELMCGGASEAQLVSSHWVPPIR